MKAVIVGNIKKLHRGLNGINLIKGVHFAHPFFYCLQVKMHRFTSLAEPPEGSLDKALLCLVS